MRSLFLQCRKQEEAKEHQEDDAREERDHPYLPVTAALRSLLARRMRLVLKLVVWLVLLALPYLLFLMSLSQIHQLDNIRTIAPLSPRFVVQGTRPVRTRRIAITIITRHNVWKRLSSKMVC